jgi:membrane associated rhomboid family serine protease
LRLDDLASSGGAAVILPLGDSPNAPGRPVVTHALLGANVAVYVLVTLPLGFTPPDPADPMLAEYVRTVAEHTPPSVTVRQILAGVSAYDLFVFRHGFRPAAPSLANLFFSIFLHASLLHLAGNMLFLWIYGDNVEHRLGHARYLGAYLAAGAAATLFHTAFAARSALPLIGASGAISGILGLYFVWFPHNRVRLLILFPFLATVTVPARVLLGLYVIADNLLPFLLTRGGEAAGVAYGAHIGGFLAGLGVAWWVDRRGVTGRPREYPAASLGRPETARAPVRGLLAEGRYAEAAEAYFALPAESTRRLLEPEESLRLGEWLEESGYADAALVVYNRLLRDHRSGPNAAEALYRAGMTRLRMPGQETVAYQHFLDALDLDPPAELAARLHEALALIRRYGARRRRAT